MRALFVGLSFVAAVAAAQPRVTPAGTTSNIPGNQTGDTALLRGELEPLVFGTDAVQNAGVFVFRLDGGSINSQALGAMGGIDAVRVVRALPGLTNGLVIASAKVEGTLRALIPVSDGGFSVARGVAASSPGALTIGNFDTETEVYFETSAASVQRWRVTENAGLPELTASTAIALPAAPNALAAWHHGHRVYASLQAFGVVEIDPTQSPPTVISVVDAGPAAVATGLAIYPQRDGGALLLAAMQSLGRVRVFQLKRGAEATHLTDLIVDGVSPRAIDVTPEGFGDGFDAGLLVVSDPFSGNYKLVAWETFARAATPALPIDVPGEQSTVPVMPVTPRVPYARLERFGTLADVAFWPPQMLLVAGATIASPTVPAPLISLDGGRALSVAASSSALASAFTQNDSGVLVVVEVLDGGSLAQPFEQTLPDVPSAVSVATWPNAGSFVFTASGPTLRRFPLLSTDAGLSLGTSAETMLREPANDLVASRSGPRVYVAAPSGIFEWSMSGGVQQVVDAGGIDEPAGLALYSQRDGGALLLASAPRANRFRVYAAAGVPFPLLAEFIVTAPDGGPVIAAGKRLDVIASAFDVFPDGGARWPNGALAFVPADGGVVIVDWASVARSVTPALPIDSAVVVSGGGSAGGGRAGGAAGGGTTARAGGRATGGGGDTEEPMPTGCCSGAPSAALFPALGFLAWVTRFQRRRAAKGPANSRFPT